MPDEGINVTGPGIETEILAYRMLRQMASKIAIDVERAANGKAIVIHSEADMAALTAFRLFDRQLRQIGESFDEIAPEETARANLEVLEFPATIVMGVASAAAKTVLDLGPLVRGERGVASTAVAMEDLALISEVSGALTQRKCKVFVTHVYPPPAESERIANTLDLARERSAAARKRLSAKPDATGEEYYRRLEEARNAMEQLLITRADAAASTLPVLVRGAAIDKLLTTAPGAHLMYLKVLRAAGTNDVRRNALRSTLKRSGGVVANYLVFDADGSILLSGTADAYSGLLDEVAE